MLLFEDTPQRKLRAYGNDYEFICDPKLTIARYREALAIYVTDLGNAPLQVNNGPCHDIDCSICPLRRNNWRNNDRPMRHGCSVLIGELAGHTTSHVPNSEAKQILAHIDEILSTYE